MLFKFYLRKEKDVAEEEKKYISIHGRNEVRTQSTLKGNAEKINLCNPAKMYQIKRIFKSGTDIALSLVIHTQELRDMQIRPRKPSATNRLDPVSKNQKLPRGLTGIFIWLGRS